MAIVAVVGLLVGVISSTSADYVKFIRVFLQVRVDFNLILIIIFYLGPN